METISQMNVIPPAHILEGLSHHINYIDQIEFAGHYLKECGDLYGIEHGRINAFLIQVSSAEIMADSDGTDMALTISLIETNP